MKICIVGMGAIGSLFAGWLARGGYTVSALARGATLAALRQQGLQIRSEGVNYHYPVDVHNNTDELGPQDLLIIALKGHALRSAANSIAPLIGKHTHVLVALNGVPWCLLDKLNSVYRGNRIMALDPDGELAHAIPTDNILGCVVYPNCAVIRPGVIEHRFGHSLIIGEPGGGITSRVDAVASILETAGFKVGKSAFIEQDIWAKLLGNSTHNPISALTGASCDILLDDPLIREFSVSAMNEVIALGQKIGIASKIDAEYCNASVRALGTFKTSMLHDVEHMRPLEIDNLLTALSEIGGKIELPMPNIDALLGLMRVFGRVRHLYPN